MNIRLLTDIFYSVTARKSRAFESDSSLKSDEPRREEFRQICQHFSAAHRNLLPGYETEDELRPLLSLNLFIGYHHSQCITALTVCCVIGWAFFTHSGDRRDCVNFLLGSLGSPPSQRCCEEEEKFSCTIFNSIAEIKTFFLISRWILLLFEENLYCTNLNTTLNANSLQVKLLLFPSSGLKQCKCKWILILPTVLVHVKLPALHELTHELLFYFPYGYWSKTSDYIGLDFSWLTLERLSFSHTQYGVQVMNLLFLRKGQSETLTCVSYVHVSYGLIL